MILPACQDDILIGSCLYSMATKTTAIIASKGWAHTANSPNGPQAPELVKSWHQWNDRTYNSKSK